MRRKIIFTVTNDLTYDQRMIRICSTLAQNGYEVLLVGRRMPDSIMLTDMPFKQKRLKCVFRRSFWFYAEYNLRLFFFLLTRRMDAICAIDLDTIIPCYLISEVKRVRRIYDAHELFCEMKEIATRPRVYRLWKFIERKTVPRFTSGYTVNSIIAAEFRKLYNVQYEVIRNIPLLQPLNIPFKQEKYVLYQGAVNEGRSFETLIPAMKYVNARLIICGDGNFMEEAKKLCMLHGLEDKVIFEGKIPPAKLKTYTLNAWLGVTLFDDRGLSNYYSLANRFFDYLHAGVPQLCVDYPVYRDIISQYKFALLVTDTKIETIAEALNRLLAGEKLYSELQSNCIVAREHLNWQNEEKRLVAFYRNLLPEVG